MSEVVRIAITPNEPIQWPERCPQCGVSHGLVEIKSHVTRETHSYSIAFFRVFRETLSFYFPSCHKHAAQNRFAIFWLRRGGWMALFRVSMYLACFLTLFAGLQLAVGKLTLRYYLSQPGFMIFMLSGWVGLGISFWARKAAAVFPVGLDTDRNIMEIRFSQARYAREFKRLNPRTTHRHLVEKTVFFMRSGFWTLIVFLVAVAFVVKTFK